MWLGVVGAGVMGVGKMMWELSGFEGGCEALWPFLGRLAVLWRRVEADMLRD